MTAFACLLAIVIDRLAEVAAVRPRPQASPSARAPHRLARWVVQATGVLSLGLVINSALLVRKVETMPFSLPGLRADGIVDRALVAERVIEGVERGGPYPPGSRLYVWSPARGAPDTPMDAPELYWERNVRAAMQDGLAARVHYPHLVEAKFVRDPLPSRRGDYYAVYDIDGSTRVITAQELDSLLTLEPAGRRPAEPDAEPTRAGG